jgi:hypothetical protein
MKTEYKFFNKYFFLTYPDFNNYFLLLMIFPCNDEYISLSKILLVRAENYKVVEESWLILWTNANINNVIRQYHLTPLWTKHEETRLLMEWDFLLFILKKLNPQWCKLDNFSLAVKHWDEHPKICWWTRCSICCEWKHNAITIHMTNIRKSKWEIKNAIVISW